MACSFTVTFLYGRFAALPDTQLLDRCHIQAPCLAFLVQRALAKVTDDFELIIIICSPSQGERLCRHSFTICVARLHQAHMENIVALLVMWQCQAVSKRGSLQQRQ